MLNPEPNSYTVKHLPPLDPQHGLQAAAKRIKQDKKRPPHIIRTARELRRMEFEPIRYVVPGYVAEGCTLLAGRPKLGKSWLVLEMGLAVATGGTCLGGIQCDEGDVLYLALEDNERRLRSRIDKLFGDFTEWPERLHLATEWPQAHDGGLDAIEEWILGADNPRLITVDVLTMFRPARGNRDTQYEADYNAIKALQTLASKYNVAIVVVHHVRKAMGEGDPIEKVSGTLGLSGAADTIVVLDRDSNGATIYGRGRDIEEIESAVQYDKTACRWVVLGEATEVRRSDERLEILAILKEAEEPMSPTEIASTLGRRSNNIKQLLSKMMKSGEVHKTVKGKYVHPDRPVTAASIFNPDNRGNPDNQADDYRRASQGW